MVELLPFCCSKLRMFKDFLKNSSEDRNLLCKRTTTPSVKSDLKTFQAQLRCGISNAIHEICHIIGIQLPSYFIVYVQVYTFQTIIAMELVLTEKSNFSFLLFWELHNVTLKCTQALYFWCDKFKVSLEEIVSFFIHFLPNQTILRMTVLSSYQEYSPIVSCWKN